MNETELKRLCETAGRVLTGKTVTIRLKPPITKQFTGEIYTSPGGYVINIKPDISDETFLYVLCHELAHCKLNHPSDVDYTREPGSMQLTPYGETVRKVHPVVVDRERSAEELGSSWLKYAEENYQKYSGFTKLEQQLRCLSGYVEPGLLARAERIGAYVGLKQVELEQWKREQLKKGK